MTEQASIPPSVLPSKSFAHPDQAKPLIKMVGKMFKAKFGKGMAKKGFTTGDIKIGHKRTRYW